MMYMPILGISQNTEGLVDSFTVKVEGLGCPYCAYGLEKKFLELKDVQNQHINIETGILTFTYPFLLGLTTDQVEAQVKKSGYTAAWIRVIRASGKVEEDTLNTTSKINFFRR